MDNDPGGILTYSQAGAKFGYALLWTLIPTTIALIVVQEMAARMGAVTGKGLSDLIREEFGFRATFFTMLVLGLADLGNIVAEFAGLASGMGLFGASKYYRRPDRRISGVVGGGRELLQTGGADSGCVVDSLLHLSSVSRFSPTLTGGRRCTTPWCRNISRSSDYLIMVVGLIGTTITPWMQFYLQASVVEKGITKRQYSLCRWDVIIGCIIHRRDRIFHRSGLRRYAACVRISQHYRRRRRGRGVASPGRPDSPISCLPWD